MKVLLNSAYVALRCGEFVTANEDAGERIVLTDTLVDDFGKSELVKIASANKIEIEGNVKKLTKDVVAEIVGEGLEELDLPEVNELTDSEKAKQIVEKCLDNNEEMAEEDILTELVMGGIGVVKAPRLYTQALIDLGQKISPKTRRENVTKQLDKEFFPETYSALEKEATEIASGVKDTTQRQVLTIMRQWARKNKVEFPEKPKPVEQKIEGFSFYQSKVLGWMLEHKGATVGQLQKHIQSLRPKLEEEKAKAAAERFSGYIKFAEMWNKQEEETA
jgi:hypothetical protein